MRNTIIGLLTHADDVVLPAESEEDLIERTNHLLEAAIRIGLEINKQSY